MSETTEAPAPAAQPIEWEAKQRAYEAQRRAWDRLQAQVEAERIRRFGACRP